MKTVSILAVVALVLCISADASSRFDGSTMTAGSNILSKALGNVFAQSSPVSRQSDSKAVVLIEYAVLPPVQDRFVEIFKKLQDETEKEEGVIVFGLSRTIDENLTFYLYSEWEDMKTYGQHYESEYLKEYLEAIAKIGVVWKLHILDQISFIKPGQ